jgi:hypothetical protein
VPVKTPAEPIRTEETLIVVTWLESFEGGKTGLPECDPTIT